MKGLSAKSAAGLRFIPAHAGNSAVIKARDLLPGTLGSSPRMRGTRQCTAPDFLRQSEPTTVIKSLTQLQDVVEPEPEIESRGARNQPVLIIESAKVLKSSNQFRE